jgi:hypothetical protein
MAASGRCAWAATLLGLALCTGAARAADAPTVLAGATAGYGGHVDVYGVQAVWVPRFESALLDRLGFEPRLAAQVAGWHGHDHPTAHPSLVDASLLAIARWPFAHVAGVHPFLEAGFGGHLLSHARINEDRELGSVLEFGSTGAAGIAFGAARQWELAAYVHHVSNARLAPPNDGLTYFGIALRYGVP